ncbi:HK97 family phage prohead protease [Eubacteriales bacterium OttesenSCG-928-A19]|nr:HK97 family phage prohead protease [Eubacteriales bacterium OttesenSCG-928-A19]
MRYNHSQAFMVVARHNAARPGRSNLDLTVDKGGLQFRADLSRTSAGRQLHEAVEAGLVDKMSFAFTVADGGEAYDQTTHTRTITRMQKLWDVSAVDTPAYNTTSIYARDRFAAETESERRAAEAAGRRTQTLALDIETLLTIHGGGETI